MKIYRSEIQDCDFPLEFDPQSRTWRVRKVKTTFKTFPWADVFGAIFMFAFWIAGFVFLSAYF